LRFAVDNEAKKDDKRHISAINSRDAILHHLYAKTMNKPTHKAHLDLASEVNSRMRSDHVFEDFAGELNDNQTFPAPRNFDCLKYLINTYDEQCGGFDDYSLKYVKYLVKECESLTAPSAVDASVHRLVKSCQH